MKKATKVDVQGFFRKREISSAYDAQVHTYDQKRFSGIGGMLFDQLEKTHALRWLNTCNVLQVGTATGRFAEFLPRHGCIFYGIELSPLMVHASKLRGPSERSEVIRGDAERLPIGSSTFDNVLSVRSFHFFPGPRRFLREAHRVLEPGGRLIVSFEIYTHVGDLLEKLRLLPRAKPTRTYHKIDQVERLFSEEGFTVSWSGKVTKFPLNFYWRSPQILLRLITKLHYFLPFWLGTVGSVVGEKPNDTPSID